MSEQPAAPQQEPLHQDQLAASPTSTDQEFLTRLRQKIDAVDCEIQALINNRAKLAQQVAIVKKDDVARDPKANKDNKSKDPIFYRPEREAQVLKAVMARNTGPIADEKMARLFREIMSVCLDLEAPQRIAFLGPIGTFTHAAALKHFGKAADTIPLTTITDVFREVEAGTAMYGVVPVENSSEGVVNHTLDGFLSSSLKIIGEVELPIHQNFLVAEHTKIDGLSRIYSHQQSLAQCRHWLDVNFPNIERVAVSSNVKLLAVLKMSGIRQRLQAMLQQLNMVCISFIVTLRTTQATPRAF